MKYAVFPKVMSEEGWDIGDDNSTYMWSTGSDVFVMSICRGYISYSMVKYSIRHKNAENIKPSNQHGSYETIDGIILDVATG